LIRDAAGNLYGAAANGGNTSSSCPWGSVGCGVIFRLDPLGNERVLYVFTGGADGAYSNAGLLAYKGAFYGTTYNGGNTSGSCGGFGCGVVFKITLP
jgi:uncharacterized repeat protein (TIGR03803 family)